MSEPGSPPTSTSPLLTAFEVADILRVSLRTVRRLIASNDLKTIRVGRSVRVQDSILQAFIAKSARR